ncbi:MAG: hypothetical protein HY738_19115 [Bacteroidia bacterium]|nr:hypothetical protein [Bacteroidia bacterium]
MKNFIIILISINTILPAALTAQTVNPDYTNYYRIPAMIAEDDYSLKISDIVAKMDYAKMSVEITNKTTDYLRYKGDESVFIYKHGKYQDEKGPVLIKPMDNVTKTLKISGDTRFHVDTFSFEFNGLYRIPAKGNIIAAPDFQLPASMNEFDAGPFHVKCIKVKQETQETTAKFECTYKGDNIGIVNPASLAIRLQNGQEFANDDKKEDIEILEKGEDTKFTPSFHIPAKVTDMQFATMNIIWKDTFKEVKPQLYKSKTIQIELDAGMTQGKN